MNTIPIIAGIDKCSLNNHHERRATKTKFKLKNGYATLNVNLCITKTQKQTAINEIKRKSIICQLVKLCTIDFPTSWKVNFLGK